MSGTRRSVCTSILVRNHEVNGALPAFSAVAPVYDAMAGGETTTIDVDG